MPSVPATPRTLFSQYFEWGRTALRVGVALTALYVCLFILQFLLLLPSVPKVHAAKSDRSFQLEISKNPADSKDWYVDGTITGRAPPRSAVEITIAQRVFLGSANSDGSVSVPVQLPLGAALVRIATRGSGETEARHDYLDYRGVSRHSSTGPGAELAGAPATPLSVAPVIDSALAEKDSNRLWISGRASQYCPVDFETEDGEILGPGRADYNGIFNKILTLESPPPASVRVRERKYDGSKPSELVKVTVIPELPLKRSIHIHFEEGVPVVQLEVTLPETDAHFKAFAMGYQEQRRFIETIWGWRPSFPAEVEQTVSLQQGLGVVRLTGSWFGPVDQMHIGEPDEDPLGEQLLLSAHDLVKVDFQGVRPAWFDPPLPIEWTQTSACWTGPLALPAGRFGLRFGIKLPANISAQAPNEALKKKLEPSDREEPKPEPPRPTMRDFVATDRYSPDESWLRPAWRSLIAMLPCLGFLWMAFRRRFGRLEVWPAAGAVVAILGIFSLSHLVYTLLGRVTHPWFTHLINIGLSNVEFTQQSQLSSTLRSARSNAFLLLAVGIAALAPSYFHHLKGYWSPGKTKPMKARGRFRRMVYAAFVVVWMIWGAFFGTIFFATVAWAAKNRWNDEARLGVAQFIKRHFDFFTGPTEELSSYLYQNDLWFVLAALLAVPLLLLLGWRAALFGLGVLSAVFRFLEPQRGALFEVEQSTQLFSLTQQIPWWAVIASVALTSCLFIIELFSWLVARDQVRPQRRRLRIVGTAIAVLSMAMPFLPAKWLLLLAGIVLFTVVVFLLLEAARPIEPVRSTAQRWEIGSRRVLLIGAGLALILAWPVPAPGEPLLFADLFRLFGIYTSIVVFLIAAVFLLLLKDYSDLHPTGGSVLESSVLWAAVLLFALFVVQTPSTWAFIPVPFLVAWLIAKYWLVLPAAALPDGGNFASELSENWKQRIAGALASIKAQSRMQTIEKALDKKLEAAELSPEDHQQKQKAYRDYIYQEVASPDKDQDRPLAETLFLLPGARPPWPTAIRFVQVGALLAAVPLFITLYDYLPARGIAHPYPTSDLLSVLLRSIAGWLLIAFFFGFFYIHIRGSSGLKKGLAMSAAIILPAGVYRLLNVPTLDQLRPFLFWMTQVFAFCTLLGGVEDYRTLRKYGYKLRDLLTLHNLPWISIYASSIIAAVTPVLIALVSGKVGDVAKFFIEAVLAPHAKGSP